MFAMSIFKMELIRFFEKVSMLESEVGLGNGPFILVSTAPSEGPQSMK
jgi:hypothetical protein